MADDTQKTEKDNSTDTKAVEGASMKTTKSTAKQKADTDGGDKKTKNKRRRKKRRKSKPKRRKSEFDQEILDVRRVTRVVAGGRRFTFSVTAAVGNHQGKVGVGVGKAGDISNAIGKAMDRAKKNLVTITRTEEGSLPYNVEAKYGGSVVHIRPAPGRGVVAGSSVREILRLAGIKDVSGKLVSRTKNKLNNARATVKALQELDKIKK